MSSHHSPRVVFFDVFGTVVQWRSSVSNALYRAAQHVVNATNRNLAPETRATASSISPHQWLELVERWRKSYGEFTSKYKQTNDKAFVSVDEHHYTSLKQLLDEWKLGDLFTDDEVRDLAMSWHRLDPWPDSVEGLEGLNKIDNLRTCTLSNGNVSLIEDLVRFASLPFTDIASAEQFGAYKPSPVVYTGAAKRFGVLPSQCALVAAHLYDLKAAKGVGFQTIFVERPFEEPSLPGHKDEVVKEGYVDLWIGPEDDGFREVAKRLGA